MSDSTNKPEVEIEETLEGRPGRKVFLLLIASVLFAAASAVHYVTGAPAEIPELVLRVKARHILVDKDKPEDAEKVLRELRSGASFEDLAKQYSTDPGSKNRGGDLGWFSRGQMVPPFEKACFENDIGLVSEVVKSLHGYHVIEVMEKSDMPAPAQPQLPNFNR